ERFRVFLCRDFDLAPSDCLTMIVKVPNSSWNRSAQSNLEPCLGAFRNRDAAAVSEVDDCWNLPCRPCEGLGHERRIAGGLDIDKAACVSDLFSEFRPRGLQIHTYD